MESGKILVVEDDVGIAALERKRLERAGNSVIAVATTEEAMAEIQKGGVELLVLDYMLPGGTTGLDFYEQIKNAGFNLPIIMVTGLSDEATIVKALRAGVHDFITKSVEYLDYLPDAVARVLAQEHTKKKLAQSEHQLREEQRQRIATLSQMNEEMQAMNHRLEEAHNQLLQSEKMASVGQLAAGVAHEINNPIGYIYSNISTLEGYLNNVFNVLDAYGKAESILGGHQDGAEILAEITAIKTRIDIEFLRKDVVNLVSESKEGINRVKRIVQDLKDFSHVDKTEWEWVDLHKGLDSTLNIVNNEIKYKADIIKEYNTLPPVECLSSQVNQVFMNLLVNAAHAIEERGTISIRTGQLEDWVFVEIADTGKGIPSENIKRIFDPFFTTKPVGKGTGLGLSLAYGIVKKHNGRISVESEVGAGTRFQVWLPVSQQAVRENASAPKVETTVTQAG